MLETLGENGEVALIESGVAKVLRDDIDDVGAGEIGRSTSEVGDRLPQHITEAPDVTTGLNGPVI